MRRLSNFVLIAGCGGIVALSPAMARAQADINTPLPNVMLLLQTSGSMERMFDGTLPESNPINACGHAAGSQPLNMWATLVSVLTGTINNFTCDMFLRNTTQFKTMYSFGAASATQQLPYDLNYYLPFHRIYSNGCTPVPGVTGGLTNYYDWPANAITYKDSTNTTTNCSSPSNWSQASDGILDTFATRAKFGMMTIDSFPNAATGVVVSPSVTPDGPGAMNGMWSYYPNWYSGGTPAQGFPGGCSIAPFEVGARNPAAPPWEGRLMPFGASDVTANILSSNANIQLAIQAMRPYGATPVAALLTDAQSFFFADSSTVPTQTPTCTSATPTACFGPMNDPMFACGRRNFQILISDGLISDNYAGTLDLRPACAQTVNGIPGQCPYLPAATVAANLFTGAQSCSPSGTCIPAAPQPTTQYVTTYVVGLGITNHPLGSAPTVTDENGTQQDCTLLVGNDYSPTPGHICDNTLGTLSAQLGACCALGQVAIAGAPAGDLTKPPVNLFYANNISALKSSLSTALDAITNSSTSRTLPVFASVPAGSTTVGGAAAVGYQFLSSFNTSTFGGQWSGNLQRVRYQCVSNVATLQPVDPTLGDDFAADLNSDYTVGPLRSMFTVIGPVVSSAIDSQQTLREGAVGALAPASDGLGTAAVTATTPTDAVTFATNMGSNALAFGVGATIPTACVQTLLTGSQSTCVTELVRWEEGLANAALPDQRGSQLGALYHATPVANGPPHDFLRDETYATFATAQAQRPTMLYAATTDGQLHGFKITSNVPLPTVDTRVDQLANNELWSFMPPYVLPMFLPNYNAYADMLDGGLTVKDVVYDRVVGTTATWSTVLVGAGGPGGGYYYALDVTSPASPRFLWQISKDGNGNALFGTLTPNPTVTTLAVSVSGTVHEVAVALLAGGSGPPATGTACPASGTRAALTSPSMVTGGGFAPRTQIKCYPGTNNPTRSLTVVRLDNGQVLARLFNATLDPVPTPVATGRVTVGTAPFDSPLSGTPVAYPSGTGQVADRAYIGDSDGSLWRIDFSSPTPASWTASLAWDAYAITSNDVALDGQPIQTTPIVSTNTLGNTVVLFSTGDQEVLSSSSIKTRVWSLIETPNSSTPGAVNINANWVIPISGLPAIAASTYNVNASCTTACSAPPAGTRVTGPITLFNSVAYFSTFAPTAASTNVCQPGYGSVWAVDYVNPVTAGSPLSGPKSGWVQPQLTPPNGAGTGLNWDQATGSVVYGVAVTQTPTCTGGSSSVSDPYFGSRQSLSNVNPGQFQLVIQTGKAGAPTVSGAKTNSMVQTLPAPRQSTRIDSWASVIE